MSFVEVFGGNTIYPSDVSYLALSLTANVALEWPLESNPGPDVVARIIDVDSDAAWAITMPPADETGVGQTILFNNISAFTVTVKDNGGNTIAALTTGTVWEVYLRDNSTANGLWRSFRFGAATAAAQAALLAGYGLVAQGSLLSQSQTVNTFNSDYTLGAADRSSAYIWTGGIGTLTLPAASVVANNWFVSVRNSGSGNLTVDAAGADTINGDSTLVLRPGDSCTINCDGTSFYTVGLGQDPVFAFDYTVIDLTGETSPYTLSGSELNRVAYKFEGVLTANMVVYVPATTQQYWAANDTTGGSFTLSLATAAQVAPLTVTRGARGIYYCNGADVIKADTASIATPIAISDGGTGGVTAAAARINLGGSAIGISVFTAATAALARAAFSGAASGANTDILSLTGLTTPLGVAYGGIGVATLTGIPLFAGTAAAAVATAGTDYAKPNTASTWSATQTFNGAAATLAASFKNAKEPGTTSATAATGTIAYNILTQSILYYTSNAAANWTVNLRGDGATTLNNLMTTGDWVTVVFAVTQGGTAYYNNVVQVDGTAVGVTTKWQGGAPTAGTANGVDVYTYAICKTGAAAFTVLASVASFT